MIIDWLIYAAVYSGGVISGYFLCAMFTTGTMDTLRAEYEQKLYELRNAKTIKKVVKAKRSTNE